MHSPYIGIGYYGTAQRQLDSRGYFTGVILSCCTHPLLRVHAYTHAKV